MKMLIRITTSNLSEPSCHLSSDQDDGGTKDQCRVAASEPAKVTARFDFLSVVVSGIDQCTSSDNNKGKPLWLDNA